MGQQGSGGRLMDRRAFLGTVGLLAAPLTAVAQPSERQPRVGVILRTKGTPQATQLTELRQGLRELGYVEGRDVTLEVRYAEGMLKRLPDLASELVRLQVDVIVTSGPAAIKAAKAATSTIPIVMARMDDADSYGFVASLARPGGNITGLSFQSAQLSEKWLQLLKEVVPKATGVAVLWDSTGTVQQLRAMETATRSFGLHLKVQEIRGAGDFGPAFGAAANSGVAGLVILASPLLTDHVSRLAELATKTRLPSIYYHRRFTEAGGLLAYGPRESDFSWRRAAAFVDKILKGAKPSDLPIEQPTKFELVVNLKTAKAMGLTIPPSVLLRADQVIE